MKKEKSDRKKNNIFTLVAALLLCVGMSVYSVGLLSGDMRQAANRSGEMNDEIPEESADTAEVSVETASENPSADTQVNSEIPSEPDSEPPAFQEYDITLMAVGDNLMHLGIVRTGLQSDGTYNFDFLFSGISEYLDAADIKIINQETIFGGNEHGPSGFPAFNSPTEVGDAIAAAGFNVVLHSSNHSADMGIKGMQNCISFWEEKHPEVLMTGMHAEPAEVHEIPILTIEGVDFAILNYTYSPNMETLPASIRGHLDMLCNWDENTGRIDFTTIHPDVLTDIERAEEIADVVIVCPHWGTEYAPEPSSYQMQFAEQMTQAGADLIIGTHPHVVQPVTWIESENGNRSLVFYSLGNYVSSQKNGLSMLEGMAWVTFRVKEDGVMISSPNSGIIPMVCHYTSNPVRLESVYMLEDYTQEQAEKHGIRGYGGVDLDVEDLQGWSEEILGTWRYSAKRALGQK